MNVGYLLLNRITFCNCVVTGIRFIPPGNRGNYLSILKIVFGTWYMYLILCIGQPQDGDSLCNQKKRSQSGVSNREYFADDVAADKFHVEAKLSHQRLLQNGSM
uniref:Uncharacterized protein n=1 Tax=Ascaris lumbricoides TaxID=6252 RepID=A0A9J2P4L2_ASCLU